MSEIELRPCPFCGGKPREPLYDEIEWAITCSGCSATMPAQTKGDVIDWWNTRSQSERVSRLEEALKPFARIGQNLMVEGGWSYGDEIAVELRHNFGVLDTLLVGDFRRARSALNQSDGGGNG